MINPRVLDGHSMFVRFHELKVWPEFYEAIREGVKTFEIRKDDRGFRIGDELYLREWCPKKQNYTGARSRRWITYILKGGQFGLEPGYVALGLSLKHKDGQP